MMLKVEVYVEGGFMLKVELHTPSTRLRRHSLMMLKVEDVYSRSAATFEVRGWRITVDYGAIVESRLGTMDRGSQL